MLLPSDPQPSDLTIVYPGHKSNVGRALQRLLILVYVASWAAQPRIHFPDSGITQLAS